MIFKFGVFLKIYFFEIFFRKIELEFLGGGFRNFCFIISFLGLDVVVVRELLDVGVVLEGWLD